MVWVLLLHPPSNHPLNSTISCKVVVKCIKALITWPSQMLCEKGEPCDIPEWEEDKYLYEVCQHQAATGSHMDLRTISGDCCIPRAALYFSIPVAYFLVCRSSPEVYDNMSSFKKFFLIQVLLQV